MTWIGACLVAAFLIGALIGSVFSRQREDTERDQSNADKLDYPTDTNQEASIAALARAQVALAKGANAADKRQSSHNKRSHRISFWTAVGVGTYTVFTAVIVVFSVAQYGETHRFNKKQARLLNDQLAEMRGSSRQMDQTIAAMHEQASTAQKTLVMSQRPWLYIEGNINSEGVTPGFPAGAFSTGIKNIGNSIATDVEINGKIEKRTTAFGIFVTAPNYENIPCDAVPIPTPLPGGSTREKVAIPPKREQNLRFEANLIGGRVADFARSRHTRPYLFGCIQYKWPFTTDIFHTYFFIEIRAIDAKGGEVLSYLPTELISNFRTVGEINYVHAN